MAKVRTATTSLHLEKPKKRRKGVHAKTKTTKNKGAANYKKPYQGQGK